MNSVINHSRRSLAFIILASLVLITPVTMAKGKVKKAKPVALNLEQFLEKASQNDTTFETILLDRLPLQYRRDALMPVRDYIVELKQQLHYFQGGSTHGSTGLSLSRLFADSGTQFSATINKPVISSAAARTSLQLLISQPLAQNAFGNALQLQDSIIGIENEIIRYQIVEAYEDYLASLTAAWYNWYSAYENLKVAKTAHQSGKKLLNNILERKRQRIALPVDVNKMQLSLIAKQENQIVLQEIYDELSNIIFSAIRYPQRPDIQTTYVPGPPGKATQVRDFASEYERFTETSRTYKVLNLLEQQGNLELDKAADELLPSTNLLLGYELQGEDWGMREQENNFFAGISLTWPIGRSVEKANYEIKRIQRKKTQLSNRNKHEELRTNLQNLRLQIKRERRLMDISQEKIKLAQSILKDESENYSFGKISLNDYISAVNDVDENRFSYTSHLVNLHKLHTEWLRLSDRLVDEL